MDKETRKKYVNLCDPQEPLEHDDDRLVDIDAAADETQYPRGEDWSARLSEEFEFAADKKHVFKLFTGLPGSGKTTELNTLMEVLSDKDGANLFPVYIDAFDVLDLSQHLSVSSLLAYILFYTQVAISIEKGEQENEAREKAYNSKDGFLQRAWDWLVKTEVKVDSLTILSGPRFLLETKYSNEDEKRIRSFIESNISEFKRMADAKMLDLQAEVRNMGKNGLLVIFDSLEELQGTPQSSSDVLGSAEQIFGYGAPYVRLPAHMIYTVPAAMMARKNSEVEFMPMIKLRDEDGNEFEPGIAAARKIIAKRVPDTVLQMAFGNDYERQVRRLICWTGGYPREIIRMMREVFLQRHFPVTEYGVVKIRNIIWDQYKNIIQEKQHEWLAQVACLHTLALRDDSSIRIAEQMFKNNAVLYYINQHSWYDVHPAVRDIPGVAKRIEQIRGNGTSCA